MHFKAISNDSGFQSHAHLLLDTISFISSDMIAISAGCFITYCPSTTHQLSVAWLITPPAEKRSRLAALDLFYWPGSPADGWNTELGCRLPGGFLFRETGVA